MGTTLTGNGIELMRLAALKHALKLERDHGMRLSRHVSALKTAKRVTGLKTNDRTKHIEALDRMIEDLPIRPGEIKTW